MLLPVGEDEEVSIKQVTDAIVKALNFKGDYTFDTSRADGQFRKPASNKKLLSLIGDFKFTPFEQGELLNWISDNVIHCGVSSSTGRERAVVLAKLRQREDRKEELELDLRMYDYQDIGYPIIFQPSCTASSEDNIPPWYLWGSCIKCVLRIKDAIILNRSQQPNTAESKTYHSNKTDSLTRTRKNFKDR